MFKIIKMEEPTSVSEFNIAVSNLIVIRNLLNDCIISSRNLNPFDWIHSLTNLFKEATRYMQDIDIKIKTKDIKNMLTKVNNSIKFLSLALISFMYIFIFANWL